VIFIEIQVNRTFELKLFEIRIKSILPTY
jgi:hypothetical protein